MPSRRHNYLDWAKTNAGHECVLAHSSVDLPDVSWFLRESLRSEALQHLLHADNQWGHPRLIELLAQRYHVSHDAIQITPGASTAIFLACTTLLQPNAQAIVETPNYEPIIDCIQQSHAEVREWQRCADWSLDLDRLEAMLTSRTKLIFLTNIHNPTSAITTQAELLQVHAIVERAIARFGTEIFIVVDEIYWDAVTPAPYRSVVELGSQFMSINGLSKVYGLGSLRCGWVLAAPRMIQRLRQSYKNVINLGSIITESLAALMLEQQDHWQDMAQQHIAHNRAMLKAELGDLIDRGVLVGAIPKHGSTYFPKIATNKIQQRIITLEQACHIVPGAFFGADYTDYVRIGFGGDSNLVQLNLQHLRKRLHA